MSNLFLLFSHSMTPMQEEQARIELGVEKIIEPPINIRSLWSALPPEEETLLSLLEPVIQWVDQEARKEDYILIQGDFGACYLLVQHAMESGYIPIYSTTERKAEEKILDDGGVQLTHTFRHVCFRKYGQ